jgi:hypothetical protein
MSKWAKLAAGTYEIKMFAVDSASLSIDNQLVFEVTAGQGYHAGSFVVAENGVYRFDLSYISDAAGTSGYIAYQITLDGARVENSRANDFIADTVPIDVDALGPKPPYSNDLRLTYPVFLSRPNWKSGITERLEWQTDVMISETGAEQRRPVRTYPRRSIEASFLRWAGTAIMAPVP